MYREQSLWVAGSVRLFFRPENQWVGCWPSVLVERRNRDSDIMMIRRNRAAQCSGAAARGLQASLIFNLE